MSSHEVDIHSAKLTDLPVLHRLSDCALAVHAELQCTRELGAGIALLPPVVLRQRGVHTLLGRVNRQMVAGQYRLKTDDHLAQMLALSPRLEEGAADTAWLHLIDALTAHAGRHGAHMLTAEVDEGSPLFRTMRQAGFAVYARQEIYQAREAAMLHSPGPLPGTLAEETDADAMDVQLLYANIVPRLVQPITVPSADSTGLVYRSGGRILGYVALTSGRGGLYVVPFLHPDVTGREAAAVLGTVITHMGERSERLPVFVCVRRYQDWLEEPLFELGLEPFTSQAVMVRHIAAGVRQLSFARVTTTLQMAHAVRPPTANIDFHPSADAVADDSTAYHGA